MKKILTTMLLLPSMAFATNNGNNNGTSLSASQNANLNSFQSTTVKSSANASSFSGAVANGGKSNSYSQGGSANASGGQGGNAATTNRLSVNQNQPNQVASQGAVVAIPSGSPHSCDGTVGGAINTPFSGLTAIWGHTDSTCPYEVLTTRLREMGLEHEACLVSAQYAKSQDLNFNVVMCENIRNTNVIRNK